jgi:metallophosphoesterase (TIGR00282 family)
MKILCLGDIVAKPGRKVLRELLPALKDEHSIDLVIANGENMAHGKGLTPKTVDEMKKAGVDIFTGGNHSFNKVDIYEDMDKQDTIILRPANFPDGAPGVGHKVFSTACGDVLVISLMGAVFMGAHLNNAFLVVDDILDQYSDQAFEAIIVDFHAEATAEKYAMRAHLDGRATVLFGTHTHVPTADAHITDLGMGYITDLGMCGSVDSCIGVDEKAILKRHLTQLPSKQEIALNPPFYLRGVLVEIKEGKSQSIELIQKRFSV